jgi:hypothetical protein
MCFEFEEFQDWHGQKGKQSTSFSDLSYCADGSVLRFGFFSE